MADYGVNIKVGVQNTQAITALTRKIKLTTSQVGQLNNFLVNFNDWRLGPAVVNSVGNFSKALKDARINLNDVALGSKEATAAARDFARAQDLANDALREQAELLARVRNQGRSGTLRGGTQYGGPIGPGPASATALRSPLPPSVPVALRSPMRPQSLLPQMGMTAQAGQIAGDMKEVYASILRLTEKANQEEAQKLQTLRQGTQEVEKLAQKYRGVVDTVKTARQVHLEIRRENIEAKQKAAEEAKIYLDRLSSAQKTGKERRDQMILANRQAQLEKKINETLEKREKITAAAERKKRASGSALIGGAFPLLFGQGLGASVGGAAGGFAGGMIGGEFGFGLSLVGTTIGNAFDEAQRRVKEMGNALRTLDLSKLEESSIRISEQLKFQVEKLKESGNFVKARALLEQTVAQQTGSTATVIKDIANSGNLLKAAFDEVVASGSVLLGAVAAPFAAALAGILKLVAEIFKLVNQGISFVGGLLREVEKLIDPCRSVQKAIESIGPAVTEATAEMKKFAEELRRTLVFAQQTADLDLEAARIGPDDSAKGQLARREIEYKRQLQGIQKDINTKLAEALKLSGQARIDAVREIKLLEAKNKRAAELNFITDKTKIQLQDRLRIQQELLDVERRRAAAASAATRERLQRLDQEIAAIQQRNRAENELNNLYSSFPSGIPFEGPMNAYDLKEQQARRILEQEQLDLADLRAQNIDRTLQLLKEETIQKKATLALLRLDADFVNKKRQAQESVLLGVQKEIKLIEARMAGREAEERIRQQIEDLRINAGVIGDAETERLREQLSLLEQKRQLEKQYNLEQEARVAGAGLGAGFIGEAGRAFENTLLEGGSQEEAKAIAQLTQEMTLAQMQAGLLEQQVVGIGNAFAAAMTTGVKELVEGTKTAEEVFADFLNNVANILMQTAQQMIATYIAIGIAKAFAFGFSPSPAGSQGNPFGSDVVVPGPGGSAVGGGRIPLNAYAEGGYVSGPTRALVGEGGQGEYVIPESKMRESMARYSRGARGPAVIPENGSGSGVMNEGGGTAVAAPIDVRYTVERINSVDYVTADQFQAGMRQAANQGAKQGEQQTLKRLQMSSSTRKRVGM